MYPPGTILKDKYQIEKFIGQGAFGEVYLALHRQLNARRALKILRRDLPGMGSTVNEVSQRFQLEAQIGARLDNPHVIRVYDFEPAGDELVLAMEYAPGGSLAERIEKARTTGTPIPIAEVERISLELAEGLAAIHNLDFVHRDLKPSNVLFGSDGTVKIADLGLAQVPGGPSLRSQVSQALPHPGTPSYMSPEQRTTTDYLNSASDIYALGAVVFEMLTLRVYRNVRKGTAPASLRTDTPPWLDALVKQMLAEDPDDRPFNGTEVHGLIGKAMQVVSETASKIKEEEQRRRQAEELESKNKEKADGAYWVKEQKQKIEENHPTQESERGRQEEIERQTREFESNLHREAYLLEPKRAVVKDQNRDHSFRGWLLPVAAVIVLLVIVGIIANQGILQAPALIPTMVPTARITTIPASTATMPPAQTPALKSMSALTSVPIAQITTIPAFTPAMSPTQTPVPTLILTPTQTTLPPTETAQGLIPPACTANGETWTSPKDGMTLVCVPAGPFLMGSTDSDPNAQSDEKPQHSVSLDAFWIDQTEVTNAMYRQCVQVGKCTSPGVSSAYARGDYYANPQFSSYPVIEVNWYDAQGYCAWAERGLPTEAQWEKAARGTDGRTYPWGEQTPSCSLANFLCGGDIYPVGHFTDGASPYGALDMAGNVWEWVADWYSDHYYASSPASNPTGPAGGQYKVLRGGSWADAVNNQDVANRDYGDPEYRDIYYGVGFRCSSSPGK